MRISKNLLNLIVVKNLVKFFMYFFFLFLFFVRSAKFITFSQQILDVKLLLVLI